jgi:hypothetical protein
MNAERRSRPRGRPGRLCYIPIAPGNGGIITDLSEDGLGFQAVNPIASASRIRFWFATPMDQRIEVFAELCWLSEDKRTGGVRFLPLSETARGYIADLLGQPAQAAEPAPQPATEWVPEQHEPLAPTNVPSPVEPVRVAAEPAEPRTHSVAPARQPVSAGTSSAVSSVFGLLDMPEHDVADPIMQELVAQENRASYRRGFFAGAGVIALVMLATFGILAYRHEIPFASAPSAAGSAAAQSSNDNAIPAAASSAPAVPPADAAAGAAPPAPAAANATETAAQPPAATPPAEAHSDAAPAVPPAAAPRSSSPAASSASASKSAPHSTPETSAAPARVPQPTAAPQQPAQNRRDQQNQDVAILWSAVGQGDLTAEVELADAYASGRGVQRSCEQARILWRAAATRGSSEAAQRIRAGASACR